MEVCGGLITWDVLERSARSFEEKEMEPMANGYLRERKVLRFVIGFDTRKTKFSRTFLFP